MQKTKTKSSKTIINDPIHKIIELNEDEVRVIDHPAFQRLRRIKALGFLDRVFPSAKHSRFEHSIGACHVAGMVFDSIEQVSREFTDYGTWADSSDHVGLTVAEIDSIFSKEIRDCIRIAALLHDVGHGPFSHASESIMPPIEDLIKENAEAFDFIRAALEKSKADKKKKGKTAADHEDYSLLILDLILRDLNFPKEKANLIAALKSSYVEAPSGYDKEIISILSQLVDGEIDSDRMDYLLRDSYFCGVPYGTYDLKRLQEGLCLVKDRKSNKKSFAVLRKAITAFEDFLFSRFQMHVQIYTHKIDASCNKAFEELAKKSGYVLPPSVTKYVEVDDENFCKVSVAVEENLTPMIRDRVLWPMAIQSYSNDRSNETAIFEKFTKSLGTGNFAVYNSERPFKKQSLLDFPVIAKGIGDIWISDKMRKSSELIAHYNAVFSVKRLFYKPDQKAVAQAVLESMTDVIKFEPKAALKGKRAEFAKVTGVLESGAKKSKLDKKKG